MTKFCVEDILKEELKEQDLNIDDLLQTHARTKKQKIKTVNVTYYIDNTLRGHLIEAGIDDIEELKIALEKCFDGCNVVIEEEQC